MIPIVRFDAPVAPGGYAWWYIDALSDDGRHGLTLIAFIGSVFSPYYARANRRRGTADPEDHVAINLALYGPRRHHWAMTERRKPSLRRDPASLVIGPSRLDWNGTTLSARITEITVPVPQPLRGTITLTPRALEPAVYPLDAAGAHRWQPIAPCARVTVAFDRPALSWSGDAYWDHNAGDAPLGTAFCRWNWSRLATRRGTAVFYRALRRDRGTTDLALRFTPSGGVEAITTPPACPLPITKWRLARETSADEARVTHSFEDTPFYARARIASRLDRETAEGVHETLDLDRFAHPIVQAMLPFRMPRRLL